MPSQKRRGSLKGQVYLVGSGIASLASAVYLIKDAAVPGENIHILEQDDIAGGALDGSGDPDSGYLVRGGRMHEEHYVCYWDLLSNISSYDDPGVSVRDESFEFNRRFVSNAQARLLKNGEKLDVSSFGLALQQQMELLKLLFTSEHALAAKRIEDWFDHRFFQTTFWYIWTTMFAFQKWSSLAEMRRYMKRFIHLVEGLPRLGGVMRTRYNQYHSVVVPIQRHLKQHGVQFDMNCRVADIEFELSADRKTARVLHVVNLEGEDQIFLSDDDCVFITNGSITESTDQGSWSKAPVLKDKSTSGAWKLWEKIARQHTDFGNPGVFCDNIDLQKWYSFTATLKDATFHDYMEKFTGNVDGTGGLVTLTDSNWLMSIVIARQPHFPDQPENVKVFWGYGLFPDRKGNYVDKPMSACNGAEILSELWYHLKIQELMQPVVQAGKVVNCIPVAMPFIDSLFMPRVQGDRPEVLPKGASNFAFLGQFAEVPEDCVFTVEYSVRCAQTAVYGLFETDKEVLPVYDSIHKPEVLLRALEAISR